MCKADNLPPSCAVVTKSGSLNFLKPSGPVQAGNGTALPFFSSSFFTKAPRLTLEPVQPLFDVYFRWDEVAGA